MRFHDEWGVKKQHRLNEICQEDNETRHLYENNDISKKEYEKRKKILHKEWSELSGEKEKIMKVMSLKKGEK